jgi:hypothetical protein
MSQVSNCYPKPVVEWFKNLEKLAENTENTQIFSEENTHKLIISNCTLSDESSFKVVFTNDLGSVETACFVIILGMFILFLFLY